LQAVQKPAVLVEANDKFKLEALVDRYSRRLWVTSYRVKKAPAMTRYVKEVAAASGLEKIILPARGEDRQAMEGQGFHFEGQVEGFFNGQAAHFMAFYPSPGRRLNHRAENERRIIAEVLAHSAPGRGLEKLPPGFRCRRPRTENIPALAALYRNVFATYPTPVGSTDYLAGTMGQSALYRVITERGKIISAAAAEIDPWHNNAEMTNCATLPAYRGRGLMLHLVSALGQDCRARGITCRYTLARAGSYGMNLVFHRLRYKFGGSLVNNCHISGNFETMNIWVDFDNS
jgi:putative beta-lysine N-acetyltransferase